MLRRDTCDSDKPAQPQSSTRYLLLTHNLHDSVMNREFHIAAMAEYVRKPAVGFLADFRAFIMRGNVLDLAAAFMMGVAFHNVIDTFIQGIITPAMLKPVMNAVNITEIADLQYDGIHYGSFLAAVLSFFITAFVLFMIIKVVERSRRGLIQALLHEHGDKHSVDEREASGGNMISKGSNTKETQAESDTSKSKDPQQQLLAAITDLTKAIHSLGNKDAAQTPKASTARFETSV
jgi:large conductance mechanosensitive channel